MKGSQFLSLCLVSTPSTLPLWTGIYLSLLTGEETVGMVVAYGVITCHRWSFCAPSELLIPDNHDKTGNDLILCIGASSSFSILSLVPLKCNQSRFAYC